MLDSETLVPHGFLDVKVWNRPLEADKKPRSHRYNLVPIEEKESYKWIESSQNSKIILESASEIIIIQDREGDICEQFCIVPDAKTHLLIRAKSNRVLQEDKIFFDYLASTPLQGTYRVELVGDKRRNTKKRTATIEVHYSEVTISAKQYTNKNLPKEVTLYAIEAKEVVENIETPMHWR